MSAIAFRGVRALTPLDVGDELQVGLVRRRRRNLRRRFGLGWRCVALSHDDPPTMMPSASVTAPMPMVNSSSARRYSRRFITSRVGIRRGKKAPTASTAAKASRIPAFESRASKWANCASRSRRTQSSKRSSESIRGLWQKGVTRPSDTRRRRVGPMRHDPLVTGTCPRRLLAATHSLYDAAHRERGGVDGSIRDLCSDAAKCLAQLNRELTA